MHAFIYIELIYESILELPYLHIHCDDYLDYYIVAAEDVLELRQIYNDVLYVHSFDHSVYYYYLYQICKN